MNVESDSFFKRGPGTWKLNNLILEEEQYVKYMEKCIHEQLEFTKDQKDPHQRYEQLKCMIAANTKKYCKARAQRNRDNEKRLKQELHVAIEKFAADLSDANVAKLKEIEQELLQITLTRDKGALLRRRMRWLQLGEKPNSFFLGLQKDRSSKKAILSLKSKDGSTIIKGKKGIQAEIDKFMKETISNDNSTSLANSEELIASVAEKALGGADYLELDRRLDVSEIEYALATAPKDKSPGVCGLSAQFWYKFWPQVKYLFMETLNASYDRGYLPQSLRRAIVTLIPKPGRDPETLKGYRGISLLCCDYKVIASALANRIKKVITKLIHTDQTGFIKGRQITDNIRATKDLLEYTDQNNMEGYLILTDASMAFDKLQFNYIDASLEAFNFPPTFRKYIQMMRSQCEKSAINNGHRGQFIPVERGVFQGDPLASFLYVISQETLSAAIRKDDRIKGIMVNPEGSCFKGMSYADDQSYTLADKPSIEYMVRKVDLFGECSGVLLNKQKTEAVGMGLLKNIEDTVAGIKIWPKPVKLLGHWLSYNQEQEDKLNFHDKLEKINKTLSPWVSRSLTLRGKVLVSKTLGVSQAIYSMMAGTVPTSFIKNLQTLLDKFIWNQGTSKIARHVLIQDYHNGGLKHTCVNSLHTSLKAGWMERISKDPDRKAFLFGTRQMEKAGGVRKIMESNYQVESLPGEYNTFYKQVLKCYQTASPLCGIPAGIQVLSQYLVNNKQILHVTTKGKSFFFPDMEKTTFADWFNHVTGQIKTYDDIAEGMLDPIPLEIYQAIKKAIPLGWKKTARQLMETVGPQPIPILHEKIKANEILKQKKIPAAYYYWQSCLSDFEGYKFWALLRQNRMNRDTRVYNNNYRTILHSIMTRTRLFHLKVRDNDHCPNTDTCPFTADTARHALLYCPRTRPVLQALVDLIGQREGSIFNLTETEYILGVITAPGCDLTALIENIMGLARLFIVNFRYKQKKPKKIQLNAILIFISYKLNLMYKITEEGKKDKFRSIYRQWM